MLLLLLPFLLCWQVMSFESEAEMLKRWTSLVLETDPDIITGA
jgi:DNA polymerase elongation subunit (family B)